QLSSRFLKVFFVPGNHDLWVIRDRDGMDSMGKFDILTREAASCGVSMTAERIGHISIVPLLGWYDYSFGQPDPALQDIWMDNHACRWPGAWSVRAITDFFIDKNQLDLVDKNTMVISFSHFLPRIDVMPNFIPESRRILYPVLGSSRLEDQIRQLGSDIHVYGHSHVNRDVCIDGVNYINNAFAYPHETRISAKQLKCIYSDH
ncbi:MAG TPA: metallophosphoesterase, partial [Alcaligenes sp.]|nr:metallophosphoesterase [Alcaligenes sp.]HRL27144.1 metallophosphoesterase [Alcaligenes sp.]